MADISNIADRIGLPDHMKILRMDPENPQKEEAAYTVLVNPSSYKISYEACYHNDQAIGAVESSYQFNKAKNQNMNIDLLFDSTGSLGRLPLIPEKSVLDQVNLFFDVVYVNEEDFNKTKMIKIIWGPMEFLGILKSVSISYDHFDRTGEPIRATAKCEFSGGEVKIGKPRKITDENGDRIKPVDYASEKHAVNAVLKYGNYLTVLAQQPENALPKSLRIAAEVAKLIIR